MRQRMAAGALESRSDCALLHLSPVLTHLCESRCVFTLTAKSVSASTDNCAKQLCGVNSHSLHKGITVERRRRKASGPIAQRRSRIAGLPAEASQRSVPSSSASPVSPRRHLFAGTLCHRASGVVHATLHEPMRNWELRKFEKSANPSKGGDAKPPV